jgi:release factor glutamine methyltransferase
MNLNELFRNALSELSPLDSERESIALFLLSAALGNFKRSDLVIKGNQPVDDDAASLVFIGIQKVLEGIPVQYAIGKSWFCDLEINVSPDVLIPRPETEELVYRIIEDIDLHDHSLPLNILDLCTGSGCIALALKSKFPDALVTGIDVSQRAIDIARENARKLFLDVAWNVSDVFHLEIPPGSMDIIVSNPPYVALSEKFVMSPRVLDHEPHLALFVPDADPLIFYRSISRAALTALKPSGRLYFEINERYSLEMSEMLVGQGWKHVSIMKDMYGKDRFAKAFR